MNDPECLGDGVFGQCEGDMVKLTTEDGVRMTNVIFLEPAVFVALERFVKTGEPGR